VIAITWLGHSAVLIELDGTRVLTDPAVGARAGPLRRAAPPVDPASLRAVDAVLLSHLHADHADVPSLRRVVSPVVIAPRGAGRWLARRVPGASVDEVDVGDETSVGALRVSATPAAHEGRRWPVGGSALAVGYVVRGPAGAVYFAGDTDLFPEMASLHGTIDVALLPVSGWGATLGPGHLDPERAAEAAARIAPRVAIPIHWGTLAPPWPVKGHPDPARPPREFAEAAAAAGVDVRVLQPGERTVVT
jgi:L-ascorbate metabolism protein UlaG (beta-lactamase superfamily)